jgi:Tol biopolymer transport system component
MLTIIAQLWYKIALLLTIALVVLLYLIPDKRQSDLLAYVYPNSTGKFSLMVYDPRHHISMQLLAELDNPQFEFSADGRIAFTNYLEDNTEIYVVNIYSANLPAMNISQNPDGYDYPLSWSADGHYLAFRSTQNNSPQNTLTYIWDGEKSINIPLDKNAEFYDAVWSRDGRLAITVRYAPSTRLGSEIFMWDGNSITNVSQNPSGDDAAPAWSADGRLAFISERNGMYGIWVWDGLTIKDGVPDVTAITNIALNLIPLAAPIWMSRGLLAFEALNRDSSEIHVYQWDGETVTNISPNPDSYNGSSQWSPDGKWAYVSFASRPVMLVVRDSESRVLFTTPSLSAPAWSSDGNLIYCDQNMVLTMWDGQDIIEIAQGNETVAQWRSGSGVACFYGG